jgi:hypothetical protein
MSSIFGAPIEYGQEFEDEDVVREHDASTPVTSGAMPHSSYPPPTMRGMGNDPSMGSYPLAAPYPAPRLSPGTAMVGLANPVAGLAIGTSPLAIAGLGAGALALIATAYIAATAGVGYWVGGHVAPDAGSKQAYQWSGAVANALMPGLGLGAVALVGLLSRD